MRKKNLAYEKIGERIRDVRKRKGLTQAELAGGEITRNMLSRIENGVALPSLPTLCAIADGLDVPASLLLGELDGYESYRLGAKLRTLVDSGEYLEAIKCFDESSSLDVTEEIKSSLVTALVEHSHACYCDGKISESGALLNRACEISPPTERANVLRGLLAISPIGSTADTVDKDMIRALAFDSDADALYLYAMSSLDNISKTEYSKPHEMAEKLCEHFSPIVDALCEGGYRYHIDAKLDMISADYLSAKAKLIKALTYDLTVPLLWSIYADLEFCCKCCFDFENAYKYSTLRLELMGKIK